MIHERYQALISGQRRGALPTIQRSGLWALSVPYGFGVRLRNWAFDRGWKQSYKADVPVVSVGNLTVGGTGKTPCVEFVARFYRDRGVRVAILSRGYGVSEGRNDEALVLEENLPDVPHLQGSDRSQLARIAVEELESEVLVLDDGFQHRRLKRNVDCVLIDATAPWGFGGLLPRGLLREPISGLRRAHVILLTRCDLVETAALEAIRDRVRHVVPQVSLIETTHQAALWRNAARAELPLDAFKNRPIAGFCGIGNPAAFRQSLQKLGLDVVAWRTFADHHPYTRADLDDLRSWARLLSPETALVTTQKDLVKIGLDRLGDRELWSLQIRLHILTGHEALEERLRQVL